MNKFRPTFVGFGSDQDIQSFRGPVGLVDKPVDVHMVNTDLISVGSSHGEVRLLSHPSNVLQSCQMAHRNLRSGLNLEGMAEQSTNFFSTRVIT